VVKGKSELLSDTKLEIEIPETELVTIEQLKENPHNVKEHPQKQIDGLKQLIRLEGFISPLIIDKHNMIWAGHGRIIAARELGMQRVPCVRLEHLTKKQLKAVMLMDNRINESAWNEQNVSFVLSGIPNFNFEEFHMNFDEFRITEPTEETEEIPEVPAEPKSKLGDVYQLGRHKLMCGDATKDLDQLLKGKSIDLILTDPPYGINYKSPSGSGLTKRGDYPTLANDDKKFEPDFLLSLCDRIILWGANHYCDSLPVSKMWLVWDKREGDAINNNSDCELAWCSFGGSCRLFHHKWNGMIKASEQDQKRVHPTQKPVKLFAWILDNWCKQDKIVLDPYLGSGSTLIACEQTGRTCFRMEIDCGYVDVILQRFENLTGQKAEKLE